MTDQPQTFVHDKTKPTGLLVRTAEMPLTPAEKSAPSDLYRQVMANAPTLLLPNAPERQEFIREAVNSAITAGDVYFAESFSAKRVVSLLVQLLAEEVTGLGRDLLQPDRDMWLFCAKCGNYIDDHDNAVCLYEAAYSVRVSLDRYNQETGDDHGKAALVHLNQIKGYVEFILVPVKHLAAEFARRTAGTGPQPDSGEPRDPDSEGAGGDVVSPDGAPGDPVVDGRTP